jgi:hypothetical protein
MYAIFAHSNSNERVAWMKKNKWWFVGLMAVSLIAKGACFAICKSKKLTASVYTSRNSAIQGVEIPVLPVSIITFAGLAASLFHADDKLGDSLASSAIVIHSVFVAATVIKSTSLAYASQ